MISRVLIATIVLCSQLANAEDSPIGKKATTAQECAVVFFQNFQNLPFEMLESLGVNKSDLDGISLGMPTGIVSVGFNSMRTYKKRARKSMLEKKEQYLYPILRNGTVIASFVVAPEENTWGVAQINGAGGPLDGLEELSSSLSRTPGSFLIVSVPDINTSFLGYYDADELMLTTPVDISSLNMRANTPSKATSVFELLAARLRTSAMNQSGSSVSESKR